MPDTLLGLAVFAAAVGPGYVFLRIAERWTPRRDRSTLHEAAELVVVGATTTAIAVLAVLALGEADGKIDASQIIADRSNYLIQEPMRSLASLIAVLLLSYGGAALLAYAIYTPFRVPRAARKRHRPNDTVWYAALSRDVPKENGVWVTVETPELKQISGVLRAFPTDDRDRHDLVLAPPEDGHIVVEVHGQERKELVSDRLIIRESDIRSIFVSYLPLTEER